MSKMNKSFKYDPQWAEAKKRCRLNQEDIRKAKALGMSPKSLMKNIPNPSQKWKQPVPVWIRELYEKKFGNRPAGPSAIEPPRNTPAAL